MNPIELILTLVNFPPKTDRPMISEYFVTGFSVHNSTGREAMVFAVPDKNIPNAARLA